MTPDLSYYWEGARAQCEDNEWDGKKTDNQACMFDCTVGAPKWLRPPMVVDSSGDTIVYSFRRSPFSSHQGTYRNTISIIRSTHIVYTEIENH